jgi:hypothetical protein
MKPEGRMKTKYKRMAKFRLDTRLLTILAAALAGLGAVGFFYIVQTLIV